MLRRAGRKIRTTASRPVGLALLGGSVALALTLLLVGLPGHSASRAATGRPGTPSSPRGRIVAATAGRRASPWAQVDVSARNGTPLAPSFLGLSTEYWALPVFDGNRALLERVLSLLKVPGEGPLVLRIGGDSADHSFWHPTNPGAGRAPHWVYELNSRWLRRAVALVRDLGARVILDLNLITDTPADAAGWARAALARFPR